MRIISAKQVCDAYKKFIIKNDINKNKEIELIESNFQNLLIELSKEFNNYLKKDALASVKTFYTFYPKSKFPSSSFLELIKSSEHQKRFTSYMSGVFGPYGYSISETVETHSKIYPIDNFSELLDSWYVTMYYNVECN